MANPITFIFFVELLNVQGALLVLASCEAGVRLYAFVRLFIRLFVCVFVYLCVCLFVRLWLCGFVCLCIITPRAVAPLQCALAFRNVGRTRG